MSALTTLTAAGAALFGGSALYERRNHKKSRSLVHGLQKSTIVAPTQTRAVPGLIDQQGTPWTKTLAATLRNLEDEYNWFMKTRIDPLFQGKRQALMKEIQLHDEEALVITPDERMVNRRLAIAGTVMTAALVTAPLGPLVQFVACVPLALYLIRGVYQQAYQGLKEEGRLTMMLLLAVNQTLLWFGGFYTLGGLIFVFTSLSNKLAYITEVRSQNQLVNIFGKMPRQVWVLIDGVEVEIPFDQLTTGQILVVGAGQMIPVDGVISAGHASIDQHRLTGESQPAEKGVGDAVLAATVVLAGRIEIQVEKTGQATVAAQIGEMLSQTASYQMALTAQAYQMADRSVGPTLAVAGLAGLLLGIKGVIAITSTMFGLNLLISGPLALRNYLLVATRRSILVKDGRSLDLLTTIDTVVFDKTGTLTVEQPHVTQLHTFATMPAPDVLRYAAAVEQRQSHPIARAILAHAEAQQVILPPLDETRYEMGYGLRARIDERLVRVGSDRFMALEKIALSPAVRALQAACHEKGHSLVMVAVDKQLVGAIELEPTIRPEAKAVIEQLRQRNITCYIISGDQEGPTRALAQTLGIDHYFANTLPENKAQLVEKLQQEGRAVCFVGDGINDSIALKKANVSVSLRGSTSVAMDTAQVVLMDTTLTHLPLLFQLAEEMKGNLKISQTLAIVPGFLIWGGVFFFHLGILGAFVLFEASLWAGIANAVRPLLTYRENEVAESAEIARVRD